MTIEQLAETLGIELTDEAKDAIVAYAAAEAAALKANVTAIKAEKARLQTKLDRLKALDVDAIAEALGAEPADIDLSELPDLIRAKASGGGADPKNDTRVEEMTRKVARLEKQLQDANRAAEDAGSRLKGALGDKHLSAVLSEAIAAKKGNAKLLLPHAKARIKTEVDETGAVEITILGANGEPMETSTGAPASVKDLIEEFYRSDDFGAAFEADKASGPGGKRPGGGNSRINPWAAATLNVTEQARIRRENPALADTLARQAGKAA